MTAPVQGAGNCRQNLGVELVVDVIGTPAPQGSKSFRGMSHAGHAIMSEASKLVAPWRQDVVAATAAAMTDASWRCLEGPAAVRVDFYLRRPASAPKRQVWPFRKPDTDKLLRSTLDALTTAGAIADDARVVDLHGVKHFARPGKPTGARIVIKPAADVLA